MDPKYLDLIANIDELKAERRTQRKPRRDKGSKRNPYQYHTTVEAFRIYNSIKLKSTNLNGDTSLDVNGYYQVIQTNARESIRPTGTVSKQYRYIDLERHRFNARQSAAINEPNQIVKLPNPDLTRWAIECGRMTLYEAKEYFRTKQYTNIQLFTEFYHVDEVDVAVWDYQSWLSHYNCCPKEELPSEFKFNLYYKPGTTEFMPEWAYKTQELIEQETIEQEERHKMNQWRGTLGKRRR